MCPRRALRRLRKLQRDLPRFQKLALLFLTGVGPLITWRRSSFSSLKRAFLWPAAAGIGTAGGLIAAGMRHPYALMSFLLCAFVVATIVMEFGKGALAIRAKDGGGAAAAGVG